MYIVCKSIYIFILYIHIAFVYSYYVCCVRVFSSGGIMIETLTDRNPVTTTKKKNNI
jgi:hypothetical protein